MSDNIENEESAITADETASAFAFEEWVQSLMEQTKEDPTAPYMPENLLMLVRLQYTDRALFERLRTNLNKMGITFARFDSAVKQQEKAMRQDAGEQKKNAADIVLSVVEDAEYFRTADGTPYADVIAEDGHRETWPVESRGFERWVRQRCLRRLKSIPSSDSINATINTLAAKAAIEGIEKQVHVRAAAFEGKIYIDLCDSKWRTVEIDKTGYRVIDFPPVRFRRQKGMKPLPDPVAGGKLDELRPFLNVKDDAAFVLVISWLLMALSGNGPYPILIVVGEQGTAKSTLMDLLRQLVDPHSAPLRTLPRDVRDLFIFANNALVLAFDNLSNMSDWISDALCRLSTGGGFSTRALHTDDEEMLFEAMRPILMNGIENVGTRGDLVDRAIILLLEPISEDRRKPTKQLVAEFNEKYPRIFGALLDVMAQGLRALPEVKLERQPRMADFALWATACESAEAWPRGAFLAAYEKNRAEANEEVIASSVLATAICALLNTKKAGWDGTATDLLAALRSHVDNEDILRDSRFWPQTAKVLSEKLKRVAPALRRVGINIERRNGKGHQRLIRLLRSADGENLPPPTPSAPPSDSTKTKANKGKQKKLPKFSHK
jgi:hypothetical protein